VDRRSVDKKGLIALELILLAEGSLYTGGIFKKKPFSTLTP
jgi:hypothetical protein